MLIGYCVLSFPNGIVSVSSVVRCRFLAPQVPASRVLVTISDELGSGKAMQLSTDCEILALRMIDVEHFFFAGVSAGFDSCNHHYYLY